MSDDPSKATEEEIAWAKAIKSAVEASDKLDNLSDLEYLHHAIVSKEKVKKALKRVGNMQKFKKKYGIPGDGDAEEGIQLVREFVKQQPGCIQSMGVDTQGRHVATMDYKNFIAKRVKTEKDWKVMMGGFYYLMQSMQPTIGDIRVGVVWLMDCQGMGWHNFSLEIEKRAAEFYSDSYPARIKEITMLDPPKIINAMYNLVKVFISQKIKDLIVMTKREPYLEGDKASVFPKDILPHSMGGTSTEEVMLDNVEKLLKVRAESVASFKL